MPVAAAQHSPIVGSTRPLISGDLSVAAGTEQYLSSFQAMFVQACNEAAAFATRDIRKQALAHDRWKDLAPHLSVQYDGDDFSYIVHGADNRAAADRLEYGDETSAPTGFLRKTAIRHAPILSGMVSRKLTGMVPSA